MIRCKLCLLAVLTVLGGLACEPKEAKLEAQAEPQGEVKLDKVSFADFEKAVAAHKDKVVVVDVWGEFCPPCKLKFPHLVKIHETFGKRGVVAISLSLDEADNEAAVKEFLAKSGATFQNLLLVDTEENKLLANRKVEINVPPLLHVFDKTGKLVKTFDRKSSDKEVDDFIEELIEKK